LAFQIPEGLVVGKIPTRCQAVSITPEGICLITQNDDRQAERMTSIGVLSVASEIYPIIKTGGLATSSAHSRPR